LQNLVDGYDHMSGDWFKLLDFIAIRVMLNYGYANSMLSFLSLDYYGS
jgi:hypothetical protein